MRYDESETGATSMDIEKRQKALKAKLYDWKKKGYNVSSLSNSLKKDIFVAEEHFNDLLDNINRLEKMEERFYHLDTTGFEDQARMIEGMFKDPDNIKELEEALALLEERTLLRKKDEPSSDKNAPPEVNLKEELERIREEELGKIREEEAARIRQHERSKILDEELQRMIREEERKRIRKSELESIRREEKDRMIWEERVVRQLRGVREMPKPKTGEKRMKCPSCGGSIVITSQKRPLKLRCPECGKDYTLKAKGGGSEKAVRGAKIRYKKCPKCGSPIPIISDKRPLKIICQMCNSEFVLKAKKDEAARRTALTPVGALANQTLPSLTTKSPGLETKTYGGSGMVSGWESITCSTCGRDIPGGLKVCGYCGSPIEKEGLEKRQIAHCPHCGKDIPGDTRICGYCGNTITSDITRAPMDDFELPLSPTETIQHDFGDKTRFRPLNEYELPDTPDIPPIEPLPKMGEGGEAPGGPSNVVTCTKCGNLVPRGAMFCGACGNQM
ncbi:MAG: zinc ribbon domain-containing protein [Thermoplasmata archaeon]|nr:zinc ribbon domain-containing protein [Thermoplasmata archaeon]